MQRAVLLLLALFVFQVSRADTVFYTVAQEQQCGPKNSCPASNWFRFYSCSASEQECYYHMQSWALGFFVFLALSIIPSCIGVFCGCKHREDHCC
uniref:Uncharacterized protein n=1 Tax=Steinernema glaseri TaxID=37863 RepID=A0A1I7YMT3_9BILA